MGYPTDFNNTLSKDRFLIELIHISDCLDAGTDFIGRSYKEQKSMEECLLEFSYGKGTLYSPELVSLIEENQTLQDHLKELLNTGRIQTYYEVYGIVLDEKDSTGNHTENDWQKRLDPELDSEQDEKEQLISILHESNRENYNFVHAMVRHSLLTLYVDMRSGNYHVFSRGEQHIFKELPDGKYQDFLTDHLEKIVLPEDWEKLNYHLNLSELIHFLARQEMNYECEMRILRQGEYRWAHFTFMKMEEENIIPRTMALIITDVQENHTRSDQMEAVLKDAYQSALETNKAKSIFLSSMSHDIRTPMNGILGMTQIALQHLDEKERVEDCLKKIDISSRHLIELINKVLDMSRIESGKTTLHEEPVPLKELLLNVADVCRPSAIQLHQELSVEINELENDCVMADPVRLRQIFTNILSNAVKYTPANGKIQLHAYKLSENKTEGNCYRFKVQDNGIGISKEFQEKLFESFSREDNSMTNAVQGTGLGLSIVKSMLTMMGGTVEVDSTQGVGTTFTITLQLLQAEGPLNKDLEEQVCQTFNGQRILLAEDNEINMEIACELLKNAGLTVETAKNGQEAYELFKKSSDGYYKLILMDIQMPVMNGYDAARAIRSLPGEYAAKIPVIALTANVFHDDINKAIESGMNEHITKPMDMKALGKVLGKWLTVK